MSAATLMPAGRPAAASSGSLGSACSDKSQCAVGDCTDHVCCASSTCPTCQVCGASGACEPIGDRSSALAAAKCAPLGNSCTQGYACISGKCTKGRCCASDSCGVCTSCDTGACTPLSGQDDPDGCSGQHSCSDGKCADVVVDVPTIGTNVSFGGKDQVSLAQTFRMPADGQLAEIRLVAFCNGNSSLSLELQGVDNGLPFGHIAQTQAVMPGHALMSLAFRFSPAVGLAAGDKLAVIIRSSDPSGCNLLPAAADYADGASFSQSASSSTWTQRSGDLGLRALALPL